MARATSGLSASPQSSKNRESLEAREQQPCHKSALQGRD